MNKDIRNTFIAFSGASPGISTSLTDLSYTSLDGKRIYLKYDISPAKTKLDNKWIEKSMNVVSTTRNWNTVKTLLKMFDERN